MVCFNNKVSVHIKNVYILNPVGLRHEPVSFTQMRHFEQCAGAFNEYQPYVRGHTADGISTD